MRTSTNEPRGQVVVIVAVAFTVMLALLAVLFDGANGMVTRREMQDAGDAAAISAANVIQVGNPRGCSAVAGGAPRAAVAQAARDSLAANLDWFDASTAVITCVAGYDNQAVAVDLGTTSSRFFGGIVGGNIRVNTRSAAVNQVITGSRYSIVQLNPGYQSWPNGRRGCPSVLLSGGPTVVLQATMQVNSSCTAANGGALSTNGAGGTPGLTMQNGAPIRLVGGYAAGSMSITPAPITGVAAIPDPLAKLPPVDTTGMTVTSARVTLSNETRVFSPGIYQGGIELRNSSIALLRPGIYVIQGGGLQIGAQASVLSVSAGVTTPNASWAADCPINSCGVMIFNTSGATAMGQISIAAGSTLKLRAYDPDAIAGGGVADFENILIWQDANPVPTISYEQPIVRLNGGGNVDIRGTVYAPSAKVEMGGHSGGSGGEPVNLTLQFISWDLEFRGTSTFTFYFNDDEFARPIDYGLVE